MRSLPVQLFASLVNPAVFPLVVCPRARQSVDARANQVSIVCVVHVVRPWILLCAVPVALADPDSASQASTSIDSVAIAPAPTPPTSPRTKRLEQRSKLPWQLPPRSSQAALAKPTVRRRRRMASQVARVDEATRRELLPGLVQCATRLKNPTRHKVATTRTTTRPKGARGVSHPTCRSSKLARLART